MTHPLLDRLRSATCGSRELDADVAIHFGAKPTLKLRDAMLGNERTVPAYFPAYTTSIDAALGLVARVFPGRHVLLDTRGPHARVYNRVPYGEADHGALAPTAPLAVLIALLTALANKEAPNE